MKTKIFALVALLALAGMGASAQLMFGVTGALHMDKQLSAGEIQAAFENGEDIWYGGFGEIAFGRLGFGISANVTAPYFSGFAEFMDMDIAGYLSYHFFKARSFLDPFVELGGGYIGSDYANSSEDTNSEDPVSATLYWYGGFGLGVNLGPIGVFGKFAYNAKINRAMEASDGSDIPSYGYVIGLDEFGNPIVESYVPALRFTLGAKLIL